jgi:thiamine kinase-like enzyme
MEPEAKAVIALLPFLSGKRVKIRRLKRGLTNRNYRLDCEGGPYVLRMLEENSRPLGIDRQVEYAAFKAAEDAGIGAEVVAFVPRKQVLVTRFVKGRRLSPKALREPAILRRVVASMRRYHACPNSGGTFSGFETVRRYYAQARRRKVPFPRSITQALRILERIEDEVGVPRRTCHCHNDLLPSNLIDDGRKVWVLDWEYAGTGDLFFDLGNLAANCLFNQEQEKLLLQYYSGKVRLADLRHLRLMRVVSDMREALWGFLQMGISKLDFDYQAYACRHLERFLRAQSAFVSKGKARSVSQEDVTHSFPLVYP